MQSSLLGIVILIIDISFYLYNKIALNNFYSILSSKVLRITINQKYNSLINNINKQNQLSSKLKQAKTQFI